MEIARTGAALRAIVDDWHRRGLTIGVVPTMGALHDGHLSLVRTSLAATDRTIVTLFVNPKQFNSAADLAAYPHTEASDCAKLTPLGAHLLFAPTVDEMYPEGFATRVSVEGISEGLCGAARPGHFDGVATVVSKLLIQTAADKAFFGEKDYQQLQVVKRLVRDLGLPTEIVPCPTIREADGLAMSSRNVRLSANERRNAPELFAIMRQAAGRITSGETVDTVLADAQTAILAAGYRAIDYLELRSVGDLVPLAIADRPARLLVAAWMGDTRLIDNLPVSTESGEGDVEKARPRLKRVA